MTDSICSYEQGQLKRREFKAWRGAGLYKSWNVGMLICKVISSITPPKLSDSAGFLVDRPASHRMLDFIQVGWSAGQRTRDPRSGLFSSRNEPVVLGLCSVRSSSQQQYMYSGVCYILLGWTGSLESGQSSDMRSGEYVH